MARTIRYLKSSPLAVAGLVVLTLGVAGIALAAIPSESDQTIHGCYKDKNGDLRLIDTEASPPETCKNNEEPISWNQQGPPGPPGEQGSSIIATLTQTANFQSGAGPDNATTMPLSGGDDVSFPADAIVFFYPGPPGIDPPDSCDPADGMPRELHVDVVVTGLPGGNPFGSELTLSAWVAPYNDANIGPQLMTMDDFRTPRSPFGAFTGGIEIRAWDTCAGEDQRWGIGGLQFGLRFGAEVATVK